MLCTSLDGNWAVLHGSENFTTDGNTSWPHLCVRNYSCPSIQEAMYHIRHWLLGTKSMFQSCQEETELHRSAETVYEVTQVTICNEKDLNNFDANIFHFLYYWLNEGNYCNCSISFPLHAQPPNLVSYTCLLCLIFLSFVIFKNLPSLFKETTFTVENTDGLAWHKIKFLLTGVRIGLLHQIWRNIFCSRIRIRTS
jgi:hypothetical protein